MSLLIVGLACSAKIDRREVRQLRKEEVKIRERVKFEPANDEVILFIGQELAAIGGLSDYDDGYFDHFGPTSGFTMYTMIRPGDVREGFTYTGLSGINSTDDWGDGDSHLDLQIADKDFSNSVLAIGLEIVNHEGEVARGEQDSLVLALGHWIKGLGRRPVFLRIGYEFDGHDWNHYNREEYIIAFRRMRSMYDSIGINNIAYVWQSKGRGSTEEELTKWYPGDEYVDWCAFSFFATENVNHPMYQFARDHGKPLFYAESTPILLDEQKNSQPIDLSNPEQANWAWNEWFSVYFKSIEDNADIVKAISYINAQWSIRPLWDDNPYFQNIDARLQLNQELANKWRAEVSKPKYLKPTPRLFDYLYDATKN